MKLGDLFPDFKGTTDRGEFDSYHKKIGEGNWGILFSHPADFTPVCTTELARAAQLAPEFAKRSVHMMALSIDTSESHKEWIKDIVEYAKDEAVNVDNFPFEIISDEGRLLANKLDMLDPEEIGGDGLPLTARSVFVVGPDRKLKTMILYPATTGRSFDEILRVIDSLQLTRKKPVATPEGWKVGSKCMIQPSLSEEKATNLFGDSIERVKLPSGKPYIRMVSHGKEEEKSIINQ